MKQIAKVKLQPGDLAWLAVVIYEVLCPEGQTLSEAFDRRILRHKNMTRLFIAYTACHCANLLPRRYDLYANAGLLLGTVVGRLSVTSTVREIEQHLRGFSTP